MLTAQLELLILTGKFSLLFNLRQVADDVGEVAGVGLMRLHLHRLLHLNLHRLHERSWLESLLELRLQILWLQWLLENWILT